MKKLAVLLLLVCCDVFSMNEVRVKFIEETSPVMVERFRNFDIDISQALRNASTLYGEKTVVENVLQFLVKNKSSIEKDHNLCANICEYIINAGNAFKNETEQQNKLRRLVYNMLCKVSTNDTASVAFKNFYELFSEKKTWISERNIKFAAYAILAYAVSVKNLGIHDVNLINELSVRSELDEGLVEIMKCTIQDAPFLVGAYYDVRPKKDTSKLGKEKRQKIKDFLQKSINEDKDDTSELESAFKKSVKNFLESKKRLYK